MSISTRVSRLFKADVHGLLDRLEEPEALLRQAVRDMETEIAAREARLAAAKRAAEAAAERRERLDAALRDLDQQLDLCLASGKDELARGVVRRKLETARLAASAAEQIVQGEAAASRLARELDDCREKLADIQRRMELFVTEADRPEGAPAVTEDDVEIALLRERERRGNAEGGR